MTPSRWLSYVKEHALSEDSQDYALWTEMMDAARLCCEGQAEVIDWSALARHLNQQLRSAYKYLKQIERSLPPAHPAREGSQTLRNLLLVMRESLDEARLALGQRQWDTVQREHQEVRKGLLLIGKAVARLDSALENRQCLSCGRWDAGKEHCSDCGGPLTVFDLTRDERADHKNMAPEYRRLRQLADHVHAHPDDAQELREHALQLAELLKATEAPTRGLTQANPEAPVDEMLEYLRAARASLVEMADWQHHRDPRRLEKGWLLLRDQLGRFEQCLEDFDTA